MEKAELAYKDYQKGMKYKDIADKYNVSINTVKSWKRRQWVVIENGVQPKKKSVHTRRTLKESSNIPPKTELLPEEIETLNNEGLTEKQRLFCLYYSKSFNATRAYQKAYECDYQTSMVSGPRLLGNVRVKNEIMRLKKERCARLMLEQEDIFQKYMDIAFADITDFLSFGQEEVPVMVDDANTGEKVQLKKIVNKVVFRESDEVDGTLISEVKQGKDGSSIKLSDRMKALQWLSDHMGWATDIQKAQLDHIRAQTDKIVGTKGNDDQMSKVDQILKEIREDAERKTS